MQTSIPIPALLTGDLPKGTNRIFTIVPKQPVPCSCLDMPELSPGHLFFQGSQPRLGTRDDLDVTLQDFPRGAPNHMDVTVCVSWEFWGQKNAAKSKQSLKL